MKKYFLFSLFLITIKLYSQNKDFLVEYNYHFANDSLNKSNKKSENMILRIHNNGYVFLPKNEYYNDTIKGSMNDLSTVMVDGKVDIKKVLDKIGNTTNNIRIFYEINQNKYFNQTNVALTKIDYEESIIPINWVLINEEKLINGYNSKKATAKIYGRIWEAWYTEEIPISYGPYKFNGLPGLIVEIKDSENYFHFELLSFNRTNLHIPNKLDYQRNKMSKIEFMEYIKNYKNNPLIVLGNSLSRLKDDEEFIKRKKERLELNNNSIERGVQYNLK